MQHVASRISLFSDDGKLKVPKVHTDNPFDILGIPKTSSYDDVKRRFVELALKHHPDVSDNADGGEVDEFIRLREAFEVIRENEDGTARLSEDEGNGWSDDEFQAWFHEETGHQDLMFRMDLSTRKEVIDVVKKQSQGGLDHGGMWAMARAMAEQQESLKKQKNTIKASITVESGSNSDISVRRRRRKK
jgi:DnaJ-class molecular chaperone